jgi:hypothetical protein
MRKAIIYLNRDERDSKRKKFASKPVFDLYPLYPVNPCKIKIVCAVLCDLCGKPFLRNYGLRYSAVGQKGMPPRGVNSPRTVSQAGASRRTRSLQMRLTLAS